MSFIKLMIVYFFALFCCSAYSQSECFQYLKLMELEKLKRPDIYPPAETKEFIQEILSEEKEEFDSLLETLSKENIASALQEKRENIKFAELHGGYGEVELSKYSLCLVQAAYKQINSNKTNNLAKPRNTFSANRKPQTISAGPVSVTLTPTNSTSSKCYDIAYENRGDKHVDIFIKLTLTNNKTGEKGTSVWLGENTQFDGIFGSANTNRLNPKTQMDMSRTGMYNNWLMAKNFIFNNQPSDLYGFNNTVESCDDITAEIPSGGLKWNENAYQRHYDACSSPIKSNRPVGC